MRRIIRRHADSFGNAIEGLLWAYRTQPNYLIHLSLSFIAIILSFFLHITAYEWIAVLILITLGLVIETLNTAIEVTVDSIDARWREDLKIAKDVAAAAMLTYALGSSIIAGIIFLPKIF